MSATLSASTPGRVRLYDVDWLRVLAIVLIFVYHAARPFDTMEPWHIKDSQTAGWMVYPMVAGAQFMMPLFWVMSGISTRFALGAHAAGEFVRRRLLRLLVPVVTLGWFILSPVQVYIEATTDQGYNAPPFSGTFWQFLPRYFTEGFYGFGGYFAWNGMHLWYLVYLLLFTLLSLPLFLYLRSAAGGKIVDALARFLVRPGAIYLLGLVPFVPEVFLPRGIPVLTWTEGGWTLGAHWIFLILGFFLVCDPRLRSAIERQRWVALLLAVATLAPLGVLAPTIESLAFGSPTYILVWGLRTINGWFWLVAILGFGSRHLNFATAGLALAGAAVLPFYILHQPIIVVLDYFVRDWAIPVGLKYPLMILAVFAIFALLYEYLIRRVPALRLVFGLEPGPARPRETTH